MVESVVIGGAVALRKKIGAAKGGCRALTITTIKEDGGVKISAIYIAVIQCLLI